jgi:hypothetical protein
VLEVSDLRDPRRIRKFLYKLGDFWEEYPDLRFGQLVMNLSRENEGFADIWEWDVETFNKRINKLRREWVA